MVAQREHELLGAASTASSHQLPPSRAETDELSEKLRTVRLEWVFSLLDLDSDGSIDTHELLRMCSSMEPSKEWSPHTNERMHTAWDLDGDGSVTVRASAATVVADSCASGG